MKNGTDLWRRFISVALALVMLISAVPAAAIAEYDVGSEEPQQNIIEVQSGRALLGAASFSPPAKSISAQAYNIESSGAGSINVVDVTDAVWNSAEDSGVRFYYEVEDSYGSKYTDTGNGPALPGGCGKVYYCSVYYTEDPSKAGKGLSNAVPVGMTQSEWFEQMKMYQKDGSFDRNGLLASLSWTESNKLQLDTKKTVADGSEVIMPVAHEYYSVFVKWEMNGTAVYGTNNGVVSVHGPSEGGGTAGGGEGGNPAGGGEGGTTSGEGGTTGGEGGGGTAGGEGGTTGGEGGGITPDPMTTGGITGAAYKIVMADGAESAQITNYAAWNSISDSGVKYYYTYAANGTIYTNNPYAGMPLPESIGKVYYCYVYYDEDPAVSGYGLDKLVPVGMQPNQWNSKYNSANTNGIIDYDKLYDELNWVDASSDTVPLEGTMQVTFGPTGSVTTETVYAHWYSALIKLVPKDQDPVYRIEDGHGAVYISECAGGGGTGGGGTGGGGGGTSPSGFVTPTKEVTAVCGRWWEGQLTQLSYVEMLDLSQNPNVNFFYKVTDSADQIYSVLPLPGYKGDISGVKYVFVYSDEDPKDSALDVMTPVGMTHEAWQNQVLAYAAAHPASPGGTVDYTGLLATLDWKTAGQGELQAYSDQQCHGSTAPSSTYSDRWYSVFIQYTGSDGVHYSTLNPRVYICLKQDNIASVEDATAIPYTTLLDEPSSYDVPAIKLQKLPKEPTTSTKSNINFRYSFTDGTTVYTDKPKPESEYNPTNSATVEYLWRYSFSENIYGEAMPPVGMTEEEWAARKEAVEEEWRNSSTPNPREQSGGRGTAALEPDYSELLESIEGWTADPILPLFDEEQLKGAGHGRSGVYKSYYCSCYVRVTLADGTKYYFLNRSGSDYHTDVHIVFGNEGEMVAPVDRLDMGIMYYNKNKGIWDNSETARNYSSMEPYTDYSVVYEFRDAFVQRFTNHVNSVYPEVSDSGNASLEFLWTYTPKETVMANNFNFDYNYYPYYLQIPAGYTEDEWAEIRSQRNDSEMKSFVENLPGWTTDNRMPLSGMPRYNGKGYYGCYVRLKVDGLIVGFWNDLPAICVDVFNQKGPDILRDWAFNIAELEPGSETMTYTFDYSYQSGSLIPENKAYQWYVADTRNSEGTPIDGATDKTLTLHFDPKMPTDKYYYCNYSYDIKYSGRRVNAETNAGRFTLTNAPTGRMDVYFGAYCYGVEYAGFERFRSESNRSDYTASSREYGARTTSKYVVNGRSYDHVIQGKQILGSKTTLSAFWYISQGDCEYISWQWYESESVADLGHPIGDQELVFNPKEDGFTDLEANRKAKITLTCPSNEIGDKYYRVVCYYYNEKGDYYSYTSDILRVTTLPDTAAEDMFEVDENGRLTAYYGFEDTVTVPATVGGVQVTTIATGFNCSAPKVILPEGVTSIERDAFKNCLGLREIVLPTTLETIGEYAFQGCALDSLVIPGGVSSIGFGAFMFAFTPETEVIIRCDSNNVMEISKGAFYCSNMGIVTFDVEKSPVFNCGETRIEIVNNDWNQSFPYSFDHCTYLRLINLPETVALDYTNRANWPFRFCKRLTWIENIDSLGDKRPTGIDEGPIQAYYQRIGNSGTGTNHLFLVKTEGKEMYICSYENMNDYPLLEIQTVVDTIRIEKVMFFSGDTLELPSKIGTYDVTGVGMPGGYNDNAINNNRYPSLGYGFTDDITALKHLTLPSSLLCIMEKTFKNADLHTVNLSELNNLRYIGMDAFREQKNIKGELSFNKDTIIMDRAFLYCKGLTAVNFNGTNVSGDAFSYCINLKTVTGEWVPRIHDSYYQVTGYFFLRYFYLCPAFPDTKVYTHYYYYSMGELPVENPACYDYRVDRDYLGVESIPLGRMKQVTCSFRQYITGPYVYRGTPDEAYIFYYIGEDDTNIVFPNTIYNDELKTTFKIRGVFCSDEFINNLYTVTVEDGIEALGRQAILDETVENESGWVHFINKDGTRNRKSIPVITGMNLFGESTIDFNADLYNAIVMSGLDVFEQAHYAYHIFYVGGASFPRATGITLPDSIIDVGSVLQGTDKTVVEIPAGVKKLTGTLDKAQNVTSVIFRGSNISLFGGMGYCPNLHELDLGTNSMLVRTNYAGSALTSLRLSPNTENIYTQSFDGDMDVTIPTHSQHTPVLSSWQSDSNYNLDDYEHFDLSSDLTIYCYEGSKFDLWAQEHFKGTLVHLEETPYRLVELFDDETEEYIPIKCYTDDSYCLNIVENVKNIEWYDLTAGGEAPVGTGKELQGAAADPTHRYKAVITFGDNLISVYQIGKTMEVILEPGETYKAVSLKKRPIWTIKAKLPADWGNYVIAEQNPENLSEITIIEWGISIYDRTMTVYPGNPNEPEIVTHYASRFVNVTARSNDDLRIVLSSSTYEDYVIENLVDEDGDNLIDLGEIELTPRKTPLREYTLVGVLPDETELESLYDGGYANLSLYNKTQNIELNAYTGRKSNDRITLPKGQVMVGDVIVISVIKEAGTLARANGNSFTWEFDTYEFTVKPEGEDGTIRLPVKKNAVITANLTDEENSYIAPRKVTLHVIAENNIIFSKSVSMGKPASFCLGDGDYLFVVSDPALGYYSTDPSYNKYSDTSYYTLGVHVENSESQSIYFDTKYIPTSGTAKAGAEFRTDVIVDDKTVVSDYVPITFSTELSEHDSEKWAQWSKCEKTLEITYSGESFLVPFYGVEGKYVWYNQTQTENVHDTTLVYNEVTGETKMTVVFTGYRASFTVYVPYQNLENGYAFRMTGNDYPLYASKLSLSGVSFASGITISELPSSTSTEVGTHTITVESAEILKDTYVQVYADGELIEQNEGCGYTHFINKSRQRAFNFKINKHDPGTTVRYVIALCSDPEKRLDFNYGRPCEKHEGDYILFEEQNVLYIDNAILGSYAMWLSMYFIQHDFEGKVSQTNCDQLIAYFDETNELTYYSDPNGFRYYLRPGFMNKDNTFANKIEYQFSMKMRYPENVVDGMMTLTVEMGNGDVYDVILRYNDVTETFDGVLELPSNVYTSDTLMENFDFSYSMKEVTQTAIRITEDQPNFIQAFDNIYSKLGDFKDSLGDLKEEQAPVDIDFLAFALSIVTEHNTFGDDTEDMVSLIYSLAELENELSEGITSLEDGLNSIAFNWDLCGENGLQQMLSEMSGMIIDAQEISRSEEYLAANGYVSQQTGSAGTVYIRIVDGVAKIYIPKDEVEIELDISSLDLSVENTLETSPESVPLLGSPSKGHTYSDDWPEIHDDYDGYGPLGKWAEEVSAIIGYGKLITTTIISALSLMTKVQEKTIETVKPAYSHLNKPIMEAEVKLKSLTEEIAQKAQDIGFFTSKQETDKALAKVNKFFEKTFDEASGANKIKELEQEKALLEASRAELSKKLEQLTALDILYKQPKQITVVKQLSRTEKAKNIVISASTKVSNSPAVTLALAGLDVALGIVDLHNATVDLCTNFENNLNLVRAIWKLRQGDVSDECKTACEVMRVLLKLVREDYKAKYYIAAGKIAASIAGDVASVFGMGGKAGLYYSICTFTLGEYVDLSATLLMYPLDKQIDAQWEKIYKLCGSWDDDGHKSKNNNHKKKKTPHRTQIDPAGYVYEAVASNRLEGVTVTAYYKDDNGNPAKWNAEEYDQINPIVTDEVGVYQWYTPMGDWRVIATKPGYALATSQNDPEASEDGWLPVPPPQTSVYIGMVSEATPTVESVRFSGKEIRVEFSQYMDIGQLENNTSLISLTKNGSPVQFTFEFADREVSPKYESVYYGRILYITPAENESFDGEMAVTVSGDFKNYANKTIGSAYNSGTLSAEQIVGYIVHSYPNRLVTDIKDETEIAVRVLDTYGNPIAGRTVTVSHEFELYDIPGSAVTDANGKASFMTKSRSSGSDVLTFTCEDASVELKTYVNPIGTQKPYKPTANISDFSVVAYGTQLVIECATEGAAIRYTLDDTCPCDEDALTYTGPITITGDAFFRIASWTLEGGYSERLNIHVTCRNTDLNGDDVTDTVDASMLIVGVLFGGETAPMDLNGDSKADCLDAVYMLQSLMTDKENAPAMFIAAAYDASEKLRGTRLIDLGGEVDEVDLEFLKTADKIKFFFLDGDSAPTADAFSYTPEN